MEEKTLAEQIYEIDINVYGEEQAIKNLISIVDTVLKHDEVLTKFYKEIYGIR